MKDEFRVRGPAGHILRGRRSGELSMIRQQFAKFGLLQLISGCERLTRIVRNSRPHWVAPTDEVQALKPDLYMKQQL